MRILVTFAVEAEFAPWRRLRSFDLIRHAGRGPSFEARFGENKLGVLLTGIGRSACENALERNRASTERPDIVISSGLAGALKDCLKPMQLFVPRKVRTLRSDANADSDRELCDQARGHGAHTVDNLITMERIVCTAEEKAKLALFGEAVDMESAFVMSHFASAGVPVVALRAISDGADENLPINLDRCLTPEGAVKPLSLANAIVRRPGNLPHLVRFGKQSKRATQVLAKFLDDYVGALFLSTQRVAV